MVKLLAISDRYIPQDDMLRGLAPLAERGIDVEVRRWEHDTVEALQEANLRVEQGGPDAEPLPADIVDSLDAYDIVVTQFAPISSTFLESAENLRIIGVLRGGVENIDIEVAMQRGISVFNTPGRNARAVAECAVGLILTEIRNLARGHAALKQGEWTRDFPNRSCIPELFGRTVGLVGYGAIGKLVAKFLTAFGVKIVVSDPFMRPEDVTEKLPGQVAVTPVDLQTLLRESDIVSLHARYSPQTHHLVGRAELEMMKSTAVLINTARSGLVDEIALIESLSTRRIMGAALDVFDTEPMPPDSPFFLLDNVTLVPHLAGSTADAFRNSPGIFAAHLIRWFDGAKDDELPIINGVSSPEFLRTKKS